MVEKIQTIAYNTIPIASNIQKELYMNWLVERIATDLSLTKEEFGELKKIVSTYVLYGTIGEPSTPQVAKALEALKEELQPA